MKSTIYSLIFALAIQSVQSIWVNQLCTKDKDCSVGLICYKNQCKKQLRDNCNEGYECVYETCSNRKCSKIEVNQRCSGSDQCFSGFCYYISKNNAICKKRAGQSCSAGECTPGLTCSKGKCKFPS